MRVLFCTLASPGFVYPAIAVARALQTRGHAVAFVTGPGFNETLEQIEIERVPRAAVDGESFQVARWFYPMDIAIQVKHIEHALARFAPDVLVGHPLSMGAHIVAERHRLPVAVLGLAVHLWPVSEALVTEPPASDTDKRLVWRHGDMMRHFNDARALFKLPPSTASHRDSPLLGDLFLLQSVSELGVDIEQFPAHAHLVGACSWEPPAARDLEAWLAQSAAPVLYVHHGRSFNYPSFWPAVLDAFADPELRVAAAVGRMDRDAGAPPPSFFVRDHLSQGAVLRRARVVISGGNTTPVLGALTHGLPSLILPGGGEQSDAAELLTRAGAALTIPLGEATAQTIRAAVHELLHRAELAERAAALARAFSAFDGPARAASLIERLARARTRVTRREATKLGEGARP